MKAMLKCAVLSIIMSFPMTIAMILLLRFPIPFVGYVGPLSTHGINYLEIIDILKMATMAWVFYGMFGGFIIVSVAGLIAGYLVHRKSNNHATSDATLFKAAGFVAFMSCGLLAVLDFIIGPW